MIAAGIAKRVTADETRDGALQQRHTGGSVIKIHIDKFIAAGQRKFLGKITLILRKHVNGKVRRMLKNLEARCGQRQAPQQ